MGAELRPGRSFVGLAVIALLIACSTNQSPIPSATASPAPSVAVATPRSGAPSPTPIASPSPTPTPTATRAPIEPGQAWVEREVPEYTTEGGADLAVTVEGEDEFIHVAVSNLEGAWNEGGDASVYLRTRNDGRTWSQRLMVGGMDPRLAAAGRNVYLAVEAYRCGEGVGFMRNADHGRRGAWFTLACLTRAQNYMGSPAIAATGRLVYVASSNDETGRVAVHVSRDRGRTWTRVPLGSASDEDGYPGGDVVVAATGHRVVVAWEKRDVTYARVSEDAGRHWGPTGRVADGMTHSASARGGRLALSGAHWTCGAEVDPGVATWGRISGDPGAWVAVPMPGAVRSCSGHGGGFLELGPNANLGVLYYPDADDCAWTTSADDGATWGAPEVLPWCADELSIIWTADGRRFVLHNGGKDEYPYVLAVSP